MGLNVSLSNELSSILAGLVRPIEEHRRTGSASDRPHFRSGMGRSGTGPISEGNICVALTSFDLVKMKPKWGRRR